VILAVNGMGGRSSILKSPSLEGVLLIFPIKVNKRLMVLVLLAISFNLGFLCGVSRFSSLKADDTEISNDYMNQMFEYQLVSTNEGLKSEVSSNNLVSSIVTAPISNSQETVPVNIPTAGVPVIATNSPTVSTTTIAPTTVTTTIATKIPVIAAIATKVPVIAAIATKVPVIAAIATKVPVIAAIATKVPVTAVIAPITVTTTIATKTPATSAIAEKAASAAILNQNVSQEYPCKNFKLKKKSGHNPLRSSLTPSAQMNVLYSLASKLSTVDKMIGIDFILLHGSLIGQYLTKRALPWDDDLDVSISENHGVALNQYIRSLKFVGKNGLQDYFQDSTGFLWYIDDNPGNHIEYRLYSPCKGASPQKLMTVDNDKDTCARFYVDITILYEDSDVHVKKVVSKHRNHFQKGGRNVRIPDEMSSDVFIYKALRIGEENPKKQWILSLAHVFNKEDIYPVSKCEFNGVLLSCPKNIVKLLTQEYSSAALRPTYKTYKLAENGCWE